MSTIKITIDFSKVKRQKQLQLLRAIGFDAAKALDEKKNPSRLLIEEIDFSTLNSDVLRDLCQSVFDEMFSYRQEEFMRENMDAADDSDIEEAYNKLHFTVNDDDDVCTDPAELDDEQRCYLLADVLKEYARSSIRLTLSDAINTTKQMYQQMNWK